MASETNLSMPAAAGRATAVDVPVANQRRILFLEAGSGAGGSTTYLGYLFSYFDRSRYSPYVVFYFKNNGPDTERFRRLSVQVRFLSQKESPADYRTARLLLGRSRSALLHRVRVLVRMAAKIMVVDLPQFFALVRLIKTESVDLFVLNNDVHQNVHGVLAAWITGVPCLCHRGGGVGEGNRVKRFLTPLVQCFIAESQAMAADQAAHNPKTKRIEMIHVGVDLRLFAPRPPKEETRRSLGLKHGRKVVGYMARINEGKGQLEFVRAAAIVVKELADVDFLLVGDEGGGTRVTEMLKREAAELGLGDHVIFAGWRHDVADVLACMDVFVHVPTTWIEGAGIATMEAMAMGKPTIVSRNGGLAELPLDGESGLIVPVGEVSTLAAAMLKVLASPTLAARLGANARKRVEREFNVATIVTQWQVVFDQYLGGRRSH